MRFVLLILLLVTAARAQTTDLGALLRAASSAEPKVFAKALRKVRPRIFDVVAGGFKSVSGSQSVNPLIKKLPVSAGRTGLLSLAKTYDGFDGKVRSEWSAALRACRRAERLLYSKRKRPKDLRAAVDEVISALETTQEPWLRARLVLSLVSAAGQRLATTPSDEDVAASVTALTRLGDDAHGGLALLAHASRLAAVHDIAGADAAYASGVSDLKRSTWKSAAPPLPTFKGRALLARGEALIHLRREADAEKLLAEAAKLFKDEHPSGLRTARILLALCNVAAGDAKKAVKAVKKTLKGLFAEPLPRVLAHQAYYAGLVLRRAAAYSDAAALMHKARALLKKLGADRTLDLPLRYEEALSLLALKKEGEATALLKVLVELAVAVKRPHLGRLALQQLALHEVRKKSTDTWKPYVEELSKVSLGDPAMDKLQAAAFQAHLAVGLVGTIQLEDAVRALRKAKEQGEALGLMMDELPEAASLTAVGDQDPLEDRLMEVLPYHKSGRGTKALAYQLLERYRLIQLARRLPEKSAPADLEAAIEKNRTEMQRLFLSWSITGKPLADETARRIVTKRRSLVTKIRRDHPDVALRRFPKPEPLQKLNLASERQKAVFLYVYFHPKGSCVYAASGSYWNFNGITPKAKLHEHVKTVLEFLEGKGDRAKFLYASGELHKWLVNPILPAIENRQQVFVVSDPALKGLNLGLLVPEGTKGKTWEYTPFMLREKSWAEIPAVSLLVRMNEGLNRRAWSTNDRFAGLSRGNVDALLPIAMFFDDKMTASSAKQHLRIRLQKSPSLLEAVEPGRPLDGWFRSGGFLHVGPGVKIEPERLFGVRHYRPEAIVLSDIPDGLGDETTWITRTLLQGTDLVLMPRGGKLDPAVVEAITKRFWRGLIREGFPPTKALSKAQHDYLLGNVPVKGKRPDDAHRHPSFWGNLRLVLRRT